MENKLLVAQKMQDFLWNNDNKKLSVLNRKEYSLLIDVFFKKLFEALDEKDKIVFKNYMVFQKKILPKYRKKSCLNGKSKEITIPERVSIKVNISKKLKEKINE